MQPPLFEGAANLSDAERAARHGEAGCRRLVERCLMAIQDKDAEYRAWSSVHAAAARAAADRLDGARGAGKPLLGAPVGIKDLVEIEGHAPTFGSRAWPATRATRDAPIVARLRAAGALVVGTTNLVEFAFGSWGTNAVLGTPRNPADPAVHRVPGGSSSGSAVAVAAGMVPIAIGSDTGGSVRIPAALCGVVGYKPSSGTITMEGVLPLSAELDTIGPLARRVDDARQVDAVLSGETLGPLPKSLNGCRVVLVAPDQWGEVQPPVAEAVQEAATVLRQLGCDVQVSALPRDLATYQSLNGVIMAAEAYAALRRIVENRDLTMDENVRGRILTGADIPPEDLQAAKRARDVSIASFREDYREVDAFLLPTTPSTAIPLDEVDEASIPMSRLTRFANYLDLAAISLPCGRDAHGLPIGLQLAGFETKKNVLFSLAGAIERSGMGGEGA